MNSKVYEPYFYFYKQRPEYHDTPTTWPARRYFLSPWIYLFWIFYIIGIIHYVAFCVWLLSLSLFSKFFHVAAHVSASFLWLNDIPCCVYATLGLSIQPWVDITDIPPVGCFEYCHSEHSRITKPFPTAREPFVFPRELCNCVNFSTTSILSIDTLPFLNWVLCISVIEMKCFFLYSRPSFSKW